MIYLRKYDLGKIFVILYYLCCLIVFIGKWLLLVSEIIKEYIFFLFIRVFCGDGVEFVLRNK